jgi:hypothetical protein
MSQAVLSARGGDSVFKVVETNDFKQLPHITLTFRPGNDTAVKQVGSCDMRNTLILALAIAIRGLHHGREGR